MEYITLSKGSRAKSKSPCAFRRKRRRKSKSSREKSEGWNGKGKDPWTFGKFGKTDTLLKLAVFISQFEIELATL